MHLSVSVEGSTPLSLVCKPCRSPSTLIANRYLVQLPLELPLDLNGGEYTIPAPAIGKRCPAHGRYILINVPFHESQPALVELYSYDQVIGTVRLNTDITSDAGKQVIQAVMEDLFDTP